MSKIKKKIEGMQLEDLVAYKIPKDDMLTILESAKTENPELFDALVESIKNQYANEEGGE